MFEIQVSKKLKEKKLIALLEFLHSISTEICFSCFHKHHISEETSVEILNEYKDRCKERHHQLTSWYQQEEPFLMNVLKKLHIKTEEQFNEYKMEIFQNEMIVCKKMPLSHLGSPRSLLPLSKTKMAPFIKGIIEKVSYFGDLATETKQLYPSSQAKLNFNTPMVP